MYYLFGVAVGFAAASMLPAPDVLPDAHVHAHALFAEPEAARTPQPPPRVVIATAYCPCPICCGIWSKLSHGITHSGVKAREGWTLAADWRVFPKGGCVLLEGKKRRVWDTGSAIVGDRIDVFFNRHEDAVAFGVRRLVIEPWVC